MLKARIDKGIARHVRRPREGMSARHRENVRSLGCAVTGEPCDFHHLMALSLGRGMGRKNADRWGIGIARRIHRACHDHGNDEVYMMQTYGIDIRELAEQLWKYRDDIEGMRRVVERARLEVLRRRAA